MKKIFKKFGLLLVLGIASALFFSCNKDDEGISTNDMVGLWTFVSMSLDAEHPDPEEVKLATLAVGLSSSFMSGATLDIKSDGTFIMQIMGQSMNGTYSKEGDKLIVTSTSMNGVHGEFEEESYIILENNLLTVVEIYTEEYKSEGFTKYIQKMTFKK